MSNYAVVGNPVSHSKSPLIHTLFAKQLDQTMSYSAIPLEESEFDAFVIEFFAKGGGGLNVTVPFKEKAFKLAASCSPRAELAKAVNTLFLDAEGQICGENTDGIGLVTDIKLNHQFKIQGRDILVLGAGGAVRGVLAALIDEQAASITVVNRTVSKAAQLLDAFAGMANLQAMSYQELDEVANSGRSYDLVINGTSSSLQGEMLDIDARLLAKDCCCYDMMYADTDTVFVQWAKKHGAGLSIDGLGMLVEQAAEAFALWRGVRPSTVNIISQLRDHS